jgi:hypothetical protein
VKSTTAKKTKAKKTIAASPRKSAPKKPVRKAPAKNSAGGSAVKVAKKKSVSVQVAKMPSSKQPAPATPAPPPLNNPIDTQQANARAQRPLSMPVRPGPAVKSKPLAPAQAGRVDLPPESGYSVVVDGHFKGHHAVEPAAMADAKALKARYPFLRIEIFDAVRKTRSNVG